MVERGYRLKLAALGTALALVASGCATTAPRSPADRVPEAGEPPASTGGVGAAGSALLVQSRNERRSGDYARASATLERALRIEPSAPAIWLELARVRLLEGDFAQAEQLARKAESLAGEGSSLVAESRAIILEALRRQGRGGEAEVKPPGSGS